MKDLLLVAGLSGCGKSTFIRHAGRARLPIDILRVLPQDVPMWRHALGRKGLLARFFSNDTAKPKGQILHYDMTTSREYRRKLGEDVATLHVEERNLHEMLASAEQIRVLVIKAPKQQLIQQLANRTAVNHLPAPLRPYVGIIAPLMRGIEKVIPERLRDAAPRLLGRRWAERARVREINRQNAEFYSQDGSIEAVHRDWETFICQKIGNRLAGPVIYVEPAPKALLSKQFRIATAHRARLESEVTFKTTFARLYALAKILDRSVHIPGTQISMGLDALLGFVPVVGDAISGTIASYIIWKARRLGAPRGLVARMMMNTTMDTVVGSLPIAGDVFDVLYKSNIKNIALLRNHWANQAMALPAH